MSVVVDIIEDTADFVGDVFESVGDVAEDVWDVVSDAASDVWDFIDDNIIQPIKDDPITFIVSAIAYSTGIPGLSFAGPGTAASVSIATTGSRLAQGDDFDDAVKAGAMAGVTTGVTNSLAKGVSTGGQDWSPNLYSTADELAANALKGSAGSAAGAQGAPASSGLGDDLTRQLADADALPRDIYPDYMDLASAGDDQLVPKYGTDPYSGQSDAFGKKLNIEADLADLDDTFKRQNLKGDAQTSPNDFQKSAFGLDDTVPKEPGGYKSTVDASSSPPAKDPIVVKAGPGDPGYTPDIVEGSPRDVVRLDSAGDVIPDVPKSGWQSAKDLGGAVLERAGDWIWDGVKWVWNNPADALMYGVAGLSLLDSLNKDGPPGDQGDGGKDEDRQKADELFYRDLQQLELDRNRRDANFGRSENPYESDLYRYGETQGEHEFYGPSVYQPVEYSQPIAAAQGGSIGALNSQMPSYYRYGAMPMAMGGYASGGLNSLAYDGRSDHIPAMLSDGEYVIDAETVALLGNGSNEAGANRLESMRKEVRKQKGQALAKGKFSSNAKSPLAYMKQKSRRG